MHLHRPFCKYTADMLLIMRKVFMENKKLPFLLPIRCAVFFLLFVIGSAVTGKSLDAISHWWSVAASAVNLLTILLLVLVSRKEGGTYWTLINYEKGKTTPKQIIVMILLIVVLGMGGMFLAGFLCYGVMPYAAPMLIAPIPLWLAVINIPLLPITTAFAEDGLYLGCGVSRMKNKYAAVLVPAFFFAAAFVVDAFLSTDFFTDFVACSSSLSVIFLSNLNILIESGASPIEIERSLSSAGTLLDCAELLFILPSPPNCSISLQNISLYTPA